MTAPLPKEIVQKIRKGWDRFWFSEYPPHLLAIFRILLILTFLYRTTHYFQGGLLWDSTPSNYFGNLFYIPYFDFLTPPSHTFFSLLLRLQFVFALLALVGILTQVSLLIAGAIFMYGFFLNQSFYSHHLYFLGLQILLCAAMPCGKVLSVDYFFNRLRGLASPSQVPYTAARLLQVTVSFIYFFSALSKVSPEWLSGEVLAHSYRTLRIAPAGILAGLQNIPYGWQAWSVVLIEFFLAVGLWFGPSRLAAFAVGISNHLLMDAVMEISSYSQQMIARYLLFLNPRHFKFQKKV